jgi:hypothetical protein
VATIEIMVMWGIIIVTILPLAPRSLGGFIMLRSLALRATSGYDGNNGQH